MREFPYTMEEKICYDGCAVRGYIQKERGTEMKYMIASDIHGSAFYCRKMLEAFEEERADRLVLLGDLLYHGPRNDLPGSTLPRK